MIPSHYHKPTSGGKGKPYFKVAGLEIIGNVESLRVNHVFECSPRLINICDSTSAFDGNCIRNAEENQAMSEFET